MERLQSIKISVEIDTNKMTYERDFSDVEDMLYWLESLGLGIYTGPDQINSTNNVDNSS